MSVRAIFAGLSLALLLVLPGTVAAQQRYTISGSQSTVTYFMSHPAHDWSGTSKQATGYVALDGSGNPTEVQIRIPVTSFDSGNRNRDSHMAETVESYIYKDVSFKANKITVQPDGQWLLDGQLTFHGVTKPLRATANVTRSADRLNATGSFELKLTDFKIDLPSLLFVKVKDWIKLEYNLAAMPAKA